jgi:hypothetical protein
MQQTSRLTLVSMGYNGIDSINRSHPLFLESRIGPTLDISGRKTHSATCQISVAEALPLSLEKKKKKIV